MSKSYLTVGQAYNKLGLSGGGTNWITKSELIATGKCDESLLAGYGDHDFVIDDDIMGNSTKYIAGTMFVEKWNYSNNERYGYYKGQGGSITIRNNTMETISRIDVLLIQIQTNGSFWGPVFHGYTGKVNNANKVRVSITDTTTLKVVGTVHNNGSDWWTFMTFDVDSQIAFLNKLKNNVNKQVDYKLEFWYE